MSLPKKFLSSLILPTCPAEQSVVLDQITGQLLLNNLTNLTLVGFVVTHIRYEYIQLRNEYTQLYYE